MSLKYKEEGFFTLSGVVHILGFVFAALFVGVIYSVVIRPQAAQYQVAQEYGMEERLEGSGSLFVVLKDYEQQACFTLMVWVLMLLIYKYMQVHFEARLLMREERLQLSGRSAEALIPLPQNGRIRREDIPEIKASVTQRESADKSLHTLLLPDLILKGLERFEFSGSVHEAMDVIKGRIDLVSERLESELSIIRYVAWAIPSVGFIGTVRGIGSALAMADQALEGDISGVTASLGLAFNSTLVALFISIFLMFFIHSLQSRQEGVMHTLESYLRDYLTDRLRSDGHEEDESGEQSVEVEVSESEDKDDGAQEK